MTCSTTCGKRGFSSIRFPFNFILACPEGYLPDEGIVRKAEAAGAAREALRLSREPALLLREVQALPAGAWVVIDEVQRQPELFTNGPAPVLTTQEALDNPPPVELKTLIHMDGDEHTAYRKLGLPQFKPASLDRLQGLPEQTFNIQ